MGSAFSFSPPSPCTYSEIIELNRGTGLGAGSEEGLEDLKKFVSHLHLHGARKTSTSDNFKDTCNHLWRKSRPLLGELNRVKNKRRKKNATHSKIETQVESMFFEEEYND